MPTYPTFDGRTALTKEAVNALASQTQAATRHGASGGVTLPGVQSDTLADATGRGGFWGRLLEARVLDGVTYYAFEEQQRKPDGSWTSDEDGFFMQGAVLTEIADAAVEKMNRPGPLGDIVWLSRTDTHDTLGPLYIFSATLSGIWADVAWDEDTETYSFAQINPPDPTPLPFGFSGPPPEDAPEGTIIHTPVEKVGLPANPGRYWLAPGPPSGFVQPWVFDSYPTNVPVYETAWCDAEIDVVNQTVTFSNFHDGRYLSFLAGGSATFDSSPNLFQEFGCGLSVGNAASITQTVGADALVTLTLGPYVRDIILPGLVDIPQGGYTLDIAGSFADATPGTVTVAVGTQWLPQLGSGTPTSLILTGRFWIDYQYYP